MAEMKEKKLLSPVIFKIAIAVGALLGMLSFPPVLIIWLIIGIILMIALDVILRTAIDPMLALTVYFILSWVLMYISMFSRMNSHYRNHSI